MDSKSPRNARMEKAEAAATSGQSGKSKRRRTASSSPRRVLISGSLSNQPKGDRVEELPAPKDRRKSKRRSSMRRRSLVATLESIQSNTGKVEKSEEKHTEMQLTLDEENLPASASISAKQPSHCNANSVGPTGVSAVCDVEDTSSHGEKSIPDSESPSTDDPDAKYLDRLKAECDGWTEQLEKYKRLEKASPHFRTATSLNIENVNAKYDFWDEQVSVLEETLAASITVVSRTMDRINELKTLHEVRVKKVAEDVFNNAVQERGGDDPRLLIKKIFMLHSMMPDR